MMLRRVVRSSRITPSCPACSRHINSSSASFKESEAAATFTESPLRRVEVLNYSQGKRSARRRGEEEEEEVGNSAEREEMQGLSAALEEVEGVFDIQEKARPSRREKPASPPSRPVPLRPNASSRDFYSPPSPSGPPTLVDLNNLKPRRFIIPDHDSPEATRVVYAKIWTRAATNVGRAFNKQQLNALLGDKPNGLNLDYKDLRMRSGKLKRFWVPKKTIQMSKKELVRLALIMQWGMTDPEMIPVPKRSPRVEEVVELSDQALFLLLAPKGTTISSLTREHEVKLSFTRDRQTQVLSLIIRGTRTAASAAKDEVEAMIESSLTEGFELPLPATTLRPEVYQTISRLSKAYLAQGDAPNLLIATAGEPKYIERVERLLGQAFVHHAIQSQTPIFASLPNSPVTTSTAPTSRFAMFPYAPPTTPPWTASASTYFTRVKSVSTNSSSYLNPELEESRDLTAWSERMKFERTSRLALDSRHPTILAALRKPFLEGEQVQMRANFGHVVWPLSLGSGTAGKTGLVPVLEGQWPFAKFANWSKLQPAFKSVFLPSPPSGFLASTGSLTPTTASSPFAALLSSSLASSAVSSSPTLRSTQFRRIVYRPVELPTEDQGITSIEIEYDAAKNQLMRYKVLKSSAGMMVPEGSVDFQVSLSTRIEISDSDLGNFTLAQPYELSSYIEYNSQSFLLDEDRTIRRTVITPPSTSSLAVIGSLPYQQIQERWFDNAFERGSGVSVEIILGDGENNWSEILEIWKRGLEGLERTSKKKAVVLGDANRDLKGAAFKSTR